MYFKLKRLLDFLFVIIFTLFLFFPFFLICFLILITSGKPIFHLSKRIGKNNVIFTMYKFRTMSLSAPDKATHLLTNSSNYLTKLGGFLRKTSLDEIPQIYNILIGNMTLVGPRPALFNQHDLIKLRTSNNIHEIVPGITGWAQINGRDSISIPEKVELDKYYLYNKNLIFDLKILILTFLKILKTNDIKH